MAEEFGGRQALEEALENHVKQNKPAAGKKPKSRGLSKAAAEKMAQNLDDYDGKIVAGRLTGGP